MKNFSFLKSGLAALILCLFSVIATLNFTEKVSAKESALADKYHYLKTFTEVLSLVEKNYAEPINIEEMTEGAIKGMLQTLDPHSSYLSKELYNELQVETEGQFGGLGIEITIKDNLLTVVSPIEDSPAARAGVLPGDQIIKIGDEFSKDLSLIEAVKKMRGPKGTTITISVHRTGVRDLIPLTIVRDVIKVKSVRHRMLEDGYGYIRLAQFQEASASEFNKALAGLSEKSPGKKLKGLVIDLRNNPGGLLTQAIRVSDIFLKEGIIVYTEGRLESQKQKYYAHDDGSEPSYPIVILANKGSASASEIVSGAMQDHKRAVVVGQKTFGKGSVQTILPMEQGDALRLTTALYYTKSGRSIQAHGIEPDISVVDKRFPSEADELSEEESESAEKHKEAQKQREQDHFMIGSREAMQADLPKLLADDVQLAEGLKYLKNPVPIVRDAAAQPAASAASAPAAAATATPGPVPESTAAPQM